MDGIRKRGDRYLVDVTVGPFRKVKTVASLEQAKQVQAELRVSLGKRREDTGATAETWTLQQALEKTSALCWQDRKSGEDLRRNGEMVVEMLGKDLPLTKLSSDRIDALVEELKASGNSNGTINRKLAALSKMLSLAVRKEKLAKKPHIDRLRESEGRIRFLARDEELAVLSVFDQWGKDEHSEAFCVLIDTGMRLSELWRVEARDFDERVVNIWRTKNGQPRSVPMTGRVADILLRRAQLYPRGPLFPYDNRWFERVWDRVKDHLSLRADRQFVPHVLRHTCLSRLVQRGVPLKVVQEWAGHRTITTTMRYAHLCPTNLLEAVKVLETV